ncbi:MAG TPA: cbb3-type cytochrome oxidase assembly protein CcoS [Steroidobacteraceae bacterium]|jgi:cbb3-type cytochrome oxidase maturation protein|nr:cbb3-type cytochrome oxidase assembly protein CcoS [Steroidobacteraceae bacterium]
MSMLIWLVPVTLLLVGCAVWAFFWAADGGQFDDLDSPALAPLLDDAPEDAEPPA